MITFKTWAITAAVLSSVVFAMPTSSRAVPRAPPPAKIDAAGDGNLVQVHFRRYCRYGRCAVRYYPYGYYGEYPRPYREYLRPQYANCPPNYGYYRPTYGADRPCKSHYHPDYRDYPYRRSFFSLDSLFD